MQKKFINKGKGEILMKKRLQILAAILTLSMTALPVSAQTSDSESVNSTTSTYTSWWDYEMTYQDVKPDDWFYDSVKNVSLGNLMTAVCLILISPYSI